MRKFLLDPFAWVAALLLAGVTLVVMGASATDRAEPVIGSTVKVMRKDGHGSGVHIGKGFVVTAAHVVADEAQVALYLDNGLTIDAEVLWSNKSKDVALLRFAGPEEAVRMAGHEVAASPLACRIATHGEHVIARGSPVNQDFLSFEGRVNGSLRKMGTADVLPTDLTVIPGMSGGGVFDTDGNVVGISVATGVFQLGMFPTWARIGLIVPGKTICELMGKGV